MTAQSSCSRRRFLTQTTGGLVIISSPLGVFAQAPGAAPQPFDSRSLAPFDSRTLAQGGQPVPKRADPLAPATVNEFVRKAHADLPATKAMLAEQPSLLNATWDWGGGDFETGLGGAGHMGNREIAEFLIGHGARLDIFVAAMLGKLDIVRALLAAWPALLDSKGPHGIPLLRHARAGGDSAKPVEEYLVALGAK